MSCFLNLFRKFWGAAQGQDAVGAMVEQRLPKLGSSCQWLNAIVPIIDPLLAQAGRPFNRC